MTAISIEKLIQLYDRCLVIKSLYHSSLRSLSLDENSNVTCLVSDNYEEGLNLCNQILQSGQRATSLVSLSK